MAGSNTLTWFEALEAFEVDWSAPFVVVGLDAGGFAGELSRRGAAGIAADGDDWAFLSEEAPDEAPPSWRDLPAGVAGTVILRSAWEGRPDIADIAVDAARLLAPGGRLFVAEIDVEGLLEGSPVHYPYQFRFTLDPDAASRLAESTARHADVALATGRAGMRKVRSIGVDEVRGTYDGPAGYWTAVKEGSWPSLAESPAEVRDLLLENLAVRLEEIAPMGEIVERRPWFVATGLRG